MQPSLKTQLAIFSIGVISIITAYLFIDIPTAYWISNQTWTYTSLLKIITEISRGVIIFALLTYGVVFVRSYTRNHGNYNRRALAIANSVAISLFLTHTFKFIFSRYWPATWIDNNLSLLRDGAYGFNWFHGGAGYASFPSGHTATTVAAMIIITLLYPRLWCITVLVSALQIISLISLNYHFVSDTIAGTLLAYFVANTIVIHYRKNMDPCGNGAEKDSASLQTLQKFHPDSI